MSEEIVRGEGETRRKAGRKPKAERRERNPLEKARDRRLMSRLHLRYSLWTHEQIAVRLNELYYDKEAEERIGTGLEAPHISKQMVTAELKKLRERLDAEAIDDILTLRRQRIAEYRELEEYCYERYEATVGMHIKTRTVTGGGGDKCKDGTTTTEEEELAGESPYLTLAKACKDKILEIEGSLSPRKVSPTSPDGTKPFEGFGESEELKRLAAAFTELSKGTV